MWEEQDELERVEGERAADKRRNEYPPARGWPPPPEMRGGSDVWGSILQENSEEERRKLNETMNKGIIDSVLRAKELKPLGPEQMDKIARRDGEVSEAEAIRRLLLSDEFNDSGSRRSDFGSPSSGGRGHNRSVVLANVSPGEGDAGDCGEVRHGALQRRRHLGNQGRAEGTWPRGEGSAQEPDRIPSAADAD